MWGVACGSNTVYQLLNNGSQCLPTKRERGWMAGRTVSRTYRDGQTDRREYTDRPTDTGRQTDGQTGTPKQQRNHDLTLLLRNTIIHYKEYCICPGAC